MKIDKINLLAVSYDTHFALAFARKHPSSIDQMILIGTSGPNHIHHLPVNYDRQVARISTVASEDSTIDGQVPDMMALLKSQLAKLTVSPIVIPIKTRN